MGFWFCNCTYVAFELFFYCTSEDHEIVKKLISTTTADCSVNLHNPLCCFFQVAFTVLEKVDMEWLAVHLPVRLLSNRYSSIYTVYKSKQRFLGLHQGEMFALVCKLKI